MTSLHYQISNFESAFVNKDESNKLEDIFDSNLEFMKIWKEHLQHKIQ